MTEQLPPSSADKENAPQVETKHPPFGQSIHLEENQLPKGSRLTIFTITTMTFVFILWSCVTTVEESALAPGQVIPTSLIKVVQHLEGGIVKSLNVKEGDYIKEGEILMKLDGKASESELDTILVREKTLQIKAERLRAFGLDQHPNFETHRKELPQMVADQESIYHIQLKNKGDQLAVIEKQLEQKKAQLAINLGQDHDLREQLAVVLKERDVNKELHEKHLVTGSKYRETEERLAMVRKEVNQITNQSQEIRQEIAEKENEMLKLVTQMRNEALKDLGDTTTELSQVLEAKTKLLDRVARLDIVSPATGIIKGLKSTTLTGIIQAGAEILQIVPVDSLEVELKIKPQDIGNMRPGGKVTIKVSAFDYSRYGTVEGTLRSLSASTFTDEGPNPTPYYKGYVTLSKTYIGDNPEQNRIAPGMVVEADIDIDKKSLISYLTNTVYKAVNQSFREK